jgi:hypothetical protein
VQRGLLELQPEWCALPLGLVGQLLPTQPLTGGQQLGLLGDPCRQGCC